MISVTSEGRHGQWRGLWPLCWYFLGPCLGWKCPPFLVHLYSFTHWRLCYCSGPSHPTVGWHVDRWVQTLRPVPSEGSPPLLYYYRSDSGLLFFPKWSFPLPPDSSNRTRHTPDTLFLLEKVESSPLVLCLRMSSKGRGIVKHCHSCPGTLLSSVKVFTLPWTYSVRPVSLTDTESQDHLKVYGTRFRGIEHD